MSRPQSNGLVEFVDKKSSDKGFFCIKLAAFITKEMKESGDTSFDFWHQRFKEAESGACAYKDRCPNYAKTIAKHGRKPIQLSLNF